MRHFKGCLDKLIWSLARKGPFRAIWSWHVGVYLPCLLAATLAQASNNSEHRKGHGGSHYRAEHESTHSEAHAKNHGTQHGSTHKSIHQEKHDPHVSRRHSKDSNHAQKPTHGHSDAPHEVDHSLLAKLIPAPVKNIWAGFMTKLDQLRHLDEENEKLRKTVARLEIENAKLESLVLKDCKEKKRVRKITHQAQEEGGLVHSRTIASLKPVSDQLIAQPPKVVFESALSAFSSKNFEDAASLLMKLAENEENRNFQTAQVYFLTGISLYKLNNVKRARYFFHKAIREAHEQGGPNDRSYAPRAKAWIALCYKKLGNQVAQRKAVRSLVHEFPRSKEAQLLNRSRK